MRPAIFLPAPLSDPGSATGEPVSVFQTLGRIFASGAGVPVKNTGIV
jgi:hypothetical protein